MQNLFHKIFKLDTHQEIKPIILESINSFTIKTIKNKQDSISRTDWQINKYVPRTYFKHLDPFIQTTYFEFVKSMGASKLNINNIWFQQYQINDTHNWHCHPGTHFSNIYYLELPEDAPRTEFKHPFNINKTFSFDIKEGDVLTFPGWYVHSSPVVKSDTRKTVVVFNTCMELV